MGQGRRGGGGGCWLWFYVLGGSQPEKKSADRTFPLALRDLQTLQSKPPVSMAAECNETLVFGHCFKKHFHARETVSAKQRRRRLKHGIRREALVPRAIPLGEPFLGGPLNLEDAILTSAEEVLGHEQKIVIVPRHRISSNRSAAATPGLHDCEGHISVASGNIWRPSLTSALTGNIEKANQV